ncbi:MULTISPECIES: hypothetical protein [Chitinophagaceae]
MTWKYILICTALLFTACQSIKPLQTTILNPHSSLADSDYVAIIQPYDTASIPKDYYVGSVRTPIKGKSAITGFSDILKAYHTIAQQNGANIIRLLNIHYATSLQESDKVAALLYRVPDIRTYEKRIFWTASRKLVWDDFKSSVPDSLREDNNYSSYASIGIQHRSNASFLVGTDRFFVLSSFDCTKSWFRPYAYFQSNYLDFQQGLFDLTELYARKMRQQFKTQNVKDKNAFTSNVDKDLSQQYKEAENQYVMETRGGSDRNALKNWHDKIWKELGE